jgi:hypothetical protein
MEQIENTCQYVLDYIAMRKKISIKNPNIKFAINPKKYLD